MHLYHRPPEASTRALLSACGLTSDDIQPSDLEHFFGCGAEESPAGVVGLEFFGDVALLRSLAVAESARGLGCGKGLVSRAESYALDQGAAAIYLLTETADTLFSRLGYRLIDRASAPAAIRETSQFSSLCPASARLMVKRFRREPAQ